MRFFRKLRHLLPARRRAEELDMQEELESIRSMAEPKELGNMALAAEDARREFTWTWLEQAAQDLGYAARSMVQNKAFTLLAVFSLALGIGANTAIYSFMDSILVRPLPVPDAGSLVVMKWRTPKGYTSASSKGMSFSTNGGHSDARGYVGTQFPFPALKLFQDNADTLSSAFCYFKTRLSVSIGGQTELVSSEYVSGNYFRSMEVPTAAGRPILDEDDAAGASPVAILSYRLGQARFGEVGRAVGQTIRLDNQPFEVIGIAPPEFFGAEPGEVPDVYVPMHANLLLQQALVSATVGEQYLDPNYYWIEVMARLKPGVSITRAQAVLGPQFQQFISATSTTERQRANPPTLEIQPGGAGLDSLRRFYAQPIYVLMTMAGLILLLACANIANLLLARAVSRRREIAVRLSLGAGRVRIIRQLLTESLILSLFGGAIGIALTGYGIRLLTLLLANGRENFTLHAEINWHVLAVTFGLSLMTGLLFGLVPAFQATRVDVLPALKETRANAWSTPSHRGWQRVGVSRVLIIFQISISLLLLVAAGLFARTLSRLHSIELGFARENILLFNIRPHGSGIEDAAFNRVYQEVRSRLTQIAGIRGVSFSMGPFPSGGGSMTPVVVSGAEALPVSADGRSPSMSVVYSVGPAFFDTLQLTRLSGRDFSDRDTAGAPPVAIINERLARILKLENPVGRTIIVHQDPFEIVGVVRDAIAFQLKEELRPVVYFPYLQARPSGAITFEVRTNVRPMNLAAPAREIVRQIDSRIAVFEMKTQADHIDQSISTEITLARLCSVFAALALSIACVGLYGTVTFNVARRTSEIGIRMTLGARAGRILWMVLREVLLLAVIGLSIGLPLALSGSRYVRSFLYGIEPNDPVTLGFAIVLLLASGLVAGFIPARRAAHIDPMIAIRHE